jgi:hypothetical protein
MARAALSSPPSAKAYPRVPVVAAFVPPRVVSRCRLSVRGDGCKNNRRDAVRSGSSQSGTFFVEEARIDLASTETRMVEHLE